MTPRSTCLSVILGAALVGTIGCSPHERTAPRGPSAPSAPLPPPPSMVSNDLRIQEIAPAAGKPAEHTAVSIWGTGFQSGATVTFDGRVMAATLDGRRLDTTAPPHPGGAIDIVVTNPDGRASRLEHAFTYVEHFNASGDITIGPGDSLMVTLGGDDESCTDEGYHCRRVFIRAPADVMVDVELVLANPRQIGGLFDDETQVFSHYGPTEFPKQLRTRGGQQVWVMGWWSLFRLTARVVK